MRRLLQLVLATLAIAALAVGTVLGTVTRSSATETIADLAVPVAQMLPEASLSGPTEVDRAIRGTRSVERPNLIAADLTQHRALTLTKQRKAIAHRQAVLKKKKAVAEKKRLAAKKKKAAAAKRLGYRPGTSDPRDIARQIMKNRYGWGKSEFSCYNSIIIHESMWKLTAENPSSGAYGIPQALPGSKMASAGADWRTDPATQIKWGLGYVKSRYGTPCGAWGFKSSHGWY